MVARSDRFGSMIAEIFMDVEIRIFVYGTLKPGAANFDRYCGSNVVKIQPGYVAGYLYDLPLLGYPGMTHGGDRVYGFILSFNDGTILTALDELEDYHPHRQPTENEYTRELVTTYTLDGNVYLSAWVYLMTLDRIEQLGGVFLPDGWWEGLTIL
jgi:gamma-glutamylcyclotransferase (GGCT)/AIG2-like uncharacterized protein YtfP